MTTDISLYLLKPGDRTFNPQNDVGSYSLRDIEGGKTFDLPKCLRIGVEVREPREPLVATDAEGQQHQLSVSWLEFEVTIWTQTTPRRQVGQVHVDEKDMLPLGPARSGHATWIWEVRPEDIEVVDQARSAQAAAPIYLSVDVQGIGKLVDGSGKFYDIIAVRSSDPQQLKIEQSHWDRLLQILGYSVPPSEAALVSRGSREHPTWVEATKRLENARLHLGHGEDYDALRECLSALEGFLSSPYKVASWKSYLSLQAQKADGLAELFSGFATFCNKIGHHRSREDRGAAADLEQMPLDHWEAELALGIAQLMTTYALRLRSSGVLAEQATPAPKTEGTTENTSE